MAYTALETASIIPDVQTLVDAGITAVGLYARNDRAPFEMVQRLLGAGIKLWTVYEQGFPTSLESYAWGAMQAKADCQRLLGWMKMQGQPAGTYAGPAIDFDAPASAPIQEYLVTFHDALKQEGYLHMPYGGWTALDWALKNGYAHGSWLSGSTGWSGYDEGKDAADIVQVNAPNGVLGLSGDWNVIRNSSVLWG